MSTATAYRRAAAARRRGAIRILRRRVVAGTVAGFLVIWGVLFIQLATGHGPGLSDAANAAVVQTTDPAVTETDTATAVEPQAAIAADDAGAVTTRQS